MSTCTIILGFGNQFYVKIFGIVKFGKSLEKGKIVEIALQVWLLNFVFQGKVINDKDGNASAIALIRGFKTLSCSTFSRIRHNMSHFCADCSVSFETTSLY